MTLNDWISESIERYKDERYSALTATRANAYEFTSGFWRRFGRSFNYGETWFDKDDDWDVIFVADACRMDLFKDVHTSYGWFNYSDIESHWSCGSHSDEVMEKTFNEEYLDDIQNTALICANPFSRNIPQEIKDEFAVVDECWKDEWDEELGIVHPQVVVDKAIDAWRHRDKLDCDRVIAWMMQPHEPFRSMNSREYNPHDFGENDESALITDIWLETRDGLRDKDAVWAAYNDNLRFGLDQIQYAVESLSCEIYVTSDHGNCLGEWGVWSHPRHTPVPTLKRVPWARTLCKEYPATDYKPSYTIELGDQHIAETEELNERLENLGYA